MDCVKLRNDGVEITFQNVMAPMKVENIPEGEEYLARYSLKIDGIEVPMEMMKKALITVNGKEYASTNIKEMEGQVIPVGGKILIFAPITEFAGKKLEKGSEHELYMIIKSGEGNKEEFGPLRRTIQ